MPHLDSDPHLKDSHMTGPFMLGVRMTAKSRNSLIGLYLHCMNPSQVLSGVSCHIMLCVMIYLYMLSFSHVAFREPPYEVSESGYAGFELPIEIHFKNREEPRMIAYEYDLFLSLSESVNNIRREKLTFQNPNNEFKLKLLEAGGVSRLHDISCHVALTDPTSFCINRCASVRKVAVAAVLN